jgi:hypothetical protein
MHRQTLERFLIGKLIAYDPNHRTTNMRIRVFPADDAGINWDLETIEPALPAAAMDAFRSNVINRLQASIEATQ